MPGDKRLRNLAVVQVALGVVAAVLAPIELPDPFGLRLVLPPHGLGLILMVPFLASALGQAVLLAVWAVASAASPWKRAAGLLAGAACLEASFAIDLRGEFLGTAAVTIAVTTASLFAVRAVGVGFTRPTEEGRPERPAVEGLRFSIRGLMLFTATVALLCAGARGFQERGVRFLLLAVVWALCFAAVGIATLWAALGEARPRRRGPVVFALSAVLGAFFAYAADAHRSGWFYIILTMLLYAADLLGSLLVVRSCGYRLVKRPRPSRTRRMSGDITGGRPPSDIRPDEEFRLPSESV